MKEIKKKIKSIAQVDIKKIVAYFFIGFITFLLILFFVGADIISSCGGGGSVDQNAIAMVDGKKIHRLDFLRYRDMIVRANPTQKIPESQILNQYVSKYLFYRKAKELGFEASDEKVMKFIKETYRAEGKKYFDTEQFKDFLKRNHYSFSEFFKKSKQDVIERQFQNLIKMGFAVHPSDIIAEYRINNSIFQIQFAFLSNENLRDRLKSDNTFSNFEVTKSKDQELSKAAQGFINTINQMAKNGKSFAETAAFLRGTTGISGKFKFGEKVKDQAGNPIPAFYTRIFFEDCLTTKNMRTSRAIPTNDGIYIFTPIYFQMAEGEPTSEEYSKIENSIRTTGFITVYENMISELFSQSKIVKNLKNN